VIWQECLPKKELPFHIYQKVLWNEFLIIKNKFTVRGRTLYFVKKIIMATPKICCSVLWPEILGCLPAQMPMMRTSINSVQSHTAPGCFQAVTEHEWTPISDCLGPLLKGNLLWKTHWSSHHILTRALHSEISDLNFLSPMYFHSGRHLFLHKAFSKLSFFKSTTLFSYVPFLDISLKIYLHVNPFFSCFSKPSASTVLNCNL
jgi:hypothetical protein